MFENKFKEKIIQASKIPFEELSANGQSYQFSPKKMCNKFTNYEFEEALINVIDCLTDEIANCHDEGISKGPFIIWIANNDLINEKNELIKGITIIVTPFYLKRNQEDFYSDPCYYTLSKIKGFIRAEGGNPIMINALPRYAYKEKELYNIHLDDIFLKEAVILKDKLEKRRTMPAIIQSNTINQYRMLLENMGK